MEGLKNMLDIINLLDMHLEMTETEAAIIEFPNHSDFEEYLYKIDYIKEINSLAPIQIYWHYFNWLDPNCEIKKDSYAFFKIKEYIKIFHALKLSSFAEVLGILALMSEQVVSEYAINSIKRLLEHVHKIRMPCLYILLWTVSNKINVKYLMKIILSQALNISSETNTIVVFTRNSVLETIEFVIKPSGSEDWYNLLFCDGDIYLSLTRKAGKLLGTNYVDSTLNSYEVFFEEVIGYLVGYKSTLDAIELIYFLDRVELSNAFIKHLAQTKQTNLEHCKQIEYV